MRLLAREQMFKSKLRQLLGHRGDPNPNDVALWKAYRLSYHKNDWANYVGLFRGPLKQEEDARPE